MAGGRKAACFAFAGKALAAPGPSWAIRRFAKLQQQRHKLFVVFQYFMEKSRRICGLACQSNYLRPDQFCGLVRMPRGCFCRLSSRRITA
jgi:hypothetical protein